MTKIIQNKPTHYNCNGRKRRKYDTKQQSPRFTKVKVGIALCNSYFYKISKERTV
jgi:hypothetical protein